MIPQILQLSRVHFSYPEGRGAVLQDFNLGVSKGEKVALVGSNGTGKTTVLQILNGLLHPRRGSFFFEAAPVTRRMLRQESFRRNFRTRVVYLFPQSDVMLFNNTVFEEISFSLRLLGVVDSDARVRHWADVFGLTRLLDAYPLHLSAGERRRTCLAAIFSLNPEVVLLDEPEADIDGATSEILTTLLKAPHLTVVMATHNPALRASVCQTEVSLSTCS